MKESFVPLNLIIINIYFPLFSIISPFRTLRSYSGGLPVLFYVSRLSTGLRDGTLYLEN